MLIRLAVQADIHLIMHLISEVVPIMNASGNFQWDQTYPNTQVFEKDVLLNQLWVVELHGKIAGIAAITTDQEPEYGRVGWNTDDTAIVTHRLAVRPGYQGMGIAAVLLAKAEEIAISRGIKILRTDTNTQNQATQKLFPKAGYVFAGETTFAFRPGLLFYCYEKKL